MMRIKAVTWSLHFKKNLYNNLGMLSYNINMINDFVIP